MRYELLGGPFDGEDIEVSGDLAGYDGICERAYAGFVSVISMHGVGIPLGETFPARPHFPVHRYALGFRSAVLVYVGQIGGGE